MSPYAKPAMNILGNFVARDKASLENACVRVGRGAFARIHFNVILRMRDRRECSMAADESVASTSR